MNRIDRNNRRMKILVRPALSIDPSRRTDEIIDSASKLDNSRGDSASLSLSFGVMAEDEQADHAEKAADNPRKE
jgi:hypothetical protein